MKAYIDKAAVVAEIERRYKTNLIGAHSAFRYGKIEALREVKDFLNTLEVIGVDEEPTSKDLEKELIIWHRLHFKKGGTFEKYGGFYLANSSQLDLAKHFFELGLKAQQKEI